VGSRAVGQGKYMCEPEVAMHGVLCAPCTCRRRMRTATGSAGMTSAASKANLQVATGGMGSKTGSFSQLSGLAAASASASSSRSDLIKCGAEEEAVLASAAPAAQPGSGAGGPGAEAPVQRLLLTAHGNASQQQQQDEQQQQHQQQQKHLKVGLVGQLGGIRDRHRSCGTVRAFGSSCGQPLAGV